MEEADGGSVRLLSVRGICSGGQGAGSGAVG